MPNYFKIFATVALFAVFYAGAYLILQGAKEFERRGEMALFTNKTEMAAIESAEATQTVPTQPVVTVSEGVWK